MISLISAQKATQIWKSNSPLNLICKNESYCGYCLWLQVAESHFPTKDYSKYSQARHHLVVHRAEVPVHCGDNGTMGGSIYNSKGSIMQT